MEYAYGPYVDMSTGIGDKRFRARMAYGITTYDTKVTISIYADYDGYNPHSFTISGTNQTTENASHPLHITYSWNRTTSAFNISISETCSFNKKSSTATATVTIPALASWSVTYNSNGGSGTVNSQTKYYGINITLASDGFTWLNHSLTGWNTKADGSGTSYPLGGTYSENGAAVTLYAQWHLDYWKPSITSSECIRVDSSSSQTASNIGRYIRVKFTYTGGTRDEGATYIKPTCVIKIDNTQVYSGTLDATGTFDTAYGTYTENTSHTVSVLLYDSNDTTGTSFSIVVPSAVFPIDILGDGSAMGIMTPAVAGQALKIYVDAIYPVGSYYETSDTNFNPNTYFGGTWSSEQIKDDEIVEEGKTDIWTYRKWKSGISECWGMHTFTLSIGNAYGNGPVYYGQYTSLFPSNLFISEPVVTATRQGRAGSGLIHISPYSVTATQASYFVANTSAVYNNAPLGVSFAVRGLWKTYSAPTTKYRWHRTA